jgi:hypothetical protein
LQVAENEDGQNAIFSPEILKLFFEAAESNETAKFRVLDLAVRLAGISQEVFERVKAAGFLDRILEGTVHSLSFSLPPSPPPTYTLPRLHVILIPHGILFARSSPSTECASTDRAGALSPFFFFFLKVTSDINGA